MDPATIAAGAVALLVPYLKQAGEEFVGEAGKYAQEKARLLWQKIRAKLDGDAPTKVVLDKFEKAPEVHAEEVTAKVQETVAADKPLADDIAADVADVKRKAPYLRIVQTITEAENAVALKAKRLKAGTVDLTQNLGTVKGTAVAADIEEIG
jgi:hypothetical protein